MTTHNTPERAAARGQAAAAAPCCPRIPAGEQHQGLAASPTAPRAGGQVPGLENPVPPRGNGGTGQGDRTATSWSRTAPGEVHTAPGATAGVPPAPRGGAPAPQSSSPSSLDPGIEQPLAVNDSWAHDYRPDGEGSTPHGAVRGPAPCGPPSSPPAVRAAGGEGQPPAGGGNGPLPPAGPGALAAVPPVARAQAPAPAPPTAGRGRDRGPGDALGAVAGTPPKTPASPGNAASGLAGQEWRDAVKAEQSRQAKARRNARGGVPWPRAANTGRGRYQAGGNRRMPEKPPGGEAS